MCYTKYQISHTLTENCQKKVQNDPYKKSSMIRRKKIQEQTLRKNNNLLYDNADRICITLQLTNAFVLYIFWHNYQMIFFPTKL